MLDDRSTSPEDWRKRRYDASVQRSKERAKRFRTGSDIEVQPLYTDDDLAGWSPEEKLGYPGEFPYARGVQPTMYRGRFWTMRQYAGYATAEESNARYRY